MLSRLRAPDGAPIAGALVSWTILEPEFFGVWVGWANQCWPGVDGATREVISDEDGSFEFPEPIEPVDTPSVLWATHPLYLPALVHVELIGNEPHFPSVIEMLPGEPITARVVDALGLPVAQAEIEQTTPIPTSGLADSFDPQARRILIRKTTSGADGQSELAAWDGPMLLRASHGPLATEVWIGSPRREIELELRPTFQAQGKVLLEAGHSIEGEQRVVCSLQKGSQLQPLAVVPVEGGAWGPVSLPLFAVDGYRFRLEGWNAEVQERSLEPPAPSSTLSVDFTLRAGLEAWTFVHDDKQQPILSSTTTVMWEQPDGLLIQAQGHPREDGYTIVGGVPPGVLNVRAEAPGFVPTGGGQWDFPGDTSTAYLVLLVPGRRIEGRVLFRGEPVEDFEINSWPDNWFEQTTKAFREREDGTFVLEAVTKGLFGLTASAQGASPSETVVLNPGDSPAPLTLELRELVRGKGQVVDAATGSPLAQARIQPFHTFARITVAPWGPLLSVEGDGTFDCAGFAVGRARTRFSAPGYSVHWAESFGQPDETIDFGLIALGRRKTLTVQLAAEGDVDFAQFKLAAVGAEPIGEQYFPRSGRIVVESASAGSYRLIITDDHGFSLTDSVVLYPNEDWNVTIPIAGDCTLRAIVDSAAPIPDDASFVISLPNPGSSPIVLIKDVLPDRSYEVSSPYTGPFRVEVRGTGPMLGVVSGEIGEEDTLIEARVEIGATGQRFRVVDSKGSPVPRLRFGLWGGEEYSEGGSEETDEHGECSLASLVPGQYHAYMVHRELGYHLGVPVDVSVLSDEPVEVVFAPDLVVELELRDRAELLSAVSAQLVEVRGFFELPSITSGATGLMRWGPLGAGRFVARIRQPGLWPTDANVEARPAGVPTVVQVRRLGDLELLVKLSTGAPASGTALELESLEFETSVAGWIARGLVTSSTGAVIADGQGHVLLTGLPNGVYRWTAPGTGGTAQVLPGVMETQIVLLP